MQDLTLRELILMADIFAPGSWNTGRSTDGIMMGVPTLVNWQEDKVRAELGRMTSDDLVEPWHLHTTTDTWRSKPAGHVAREKMFRRFKWRAGCLCAPTETNLDDLVLALVAAGKVCQEGHAFEHQGERELAVYLFDFSNRIEDALTRLETLNQVKVDGRLCSPGGSKHIRLLPCGLREYQMASVRLGIPDGACVLDPQPAAVVTDAAFSQLGFDPALVQILSRRMREAESCDSIGAFLAATVMYASVLEGVLLGLAENDPKTANTSTKAPRSKSGQTKEFASWNFVDLIAVGVDVGWIPQSVRGHVSELRDSRNLVHVKKQLDEAFSADKHLVHVTRAVIDAVLDYMCEQRSTT